ncbi:MAG: preprotein translocase subunit YajC [Clostridia bacterium]|nr:preprotein translocase subunit YajC [Clostridia bacterium]
MDKWYWVILIGVLIVAYVLLIVRQKRQEKRSIETLNSFKVGDKVITHIGIYGKIKRIYNTSFGKTCVLEIGNNNKIDVEMDMRYIAGLDEKVMVADAPKEEPEIKDEVIKEKEEPTTPKKKTSQKSKTKSQSKSKK